MKLIPFTLLLLAFTYSNAQTTKTPTDTISEEKNLGQKDMDYPFPMAYSAKFKFIDPEKGKMVLNFCKNFENNTIENSKGIFADKVTIDMPKLKLKANRDSVLAAIKLYRTSFTSFKTELDVVMSVKSTDKGDDWVLVWAIDEYTDKDNVKHRVKYQQVWLLNKEGKISFMEQFDRDLK
ncbi:MAG: hypothetical protein WAT91_00070 [Saprospiraceae bacterium]